MKNLKNSLAGGVLLGALGINHPLEVLHQAHDIAEAQDPTGHTVGAEWLELVDRLAHTGEANGRSRDLLDGQGRAATGVAIQLRQDNALGTLYNMVGFQTKLKHGEQVRVFQTIPGLENAQFARLGGLHRNTFINSPRLLDPQLRLKANQNCALLGRLPVLKAMLSRRRLVCLLAEWPQLRCLVVNGLPHQPIPRMARFLRILPAVPWLIVFSQ